MTLSPNNNSAPHRRWPAWQFILTTVVLCGVLFAQDRQAKTEINPVSESEISLQEYSDSVLLADSHHIDTSNLKVRKTQDGKVTYYGRHSNGAHTASGEIHYSDDFVAAHKHLPFGTLVRVVLDNGKSVVVRINDRGPYGRGRVLDVSYGAAKELGILTKGVAKAHLEILYRPEEGNALAMRDTPDNNQP